GLVAAGNRSGRAGSNSLCARRVAALRGTHDERAAGGVVLDTTAVGAGGRGGRSADVRIRRGQGGARCRREEQRRVLHDLLRQSVFEVRRPLVRATWVATECRDDAVDGAGASD